MIRSCARYVRGFQPLAKFSTGSPLDPIPPAERQQNKTVGLNLLINRVYLTTGASFLGSIFSTFVASSIPYLAVNPFICIGLGGMMSLAGYVPSYFMKPQQVTVYEATRTYIKTSNTWKRLILYSLGCAGIGVAFVPFAAMITAFSPYFINNIMALTIGSFGGASLLITLMPKISFFREVGLLGATVGGLIAMNASNYMNKSIYGANFMSNWVQAFDTYAGVLIFFFMIAYNTKLAKREYQQGKADHLGISMRFLYDSLLFAKGTVGKLFKPSDKK